MIKPTGIADMRYLLGVKSQSFKDPSKTAALAVMKFFANLFNLILEWIHFPFVNSFHGHTKLWVEVVQSAERHLLQNLGNNSSNPSRHSSTKK